MLIFHIISGGFVLLSGILALSVRKGQALHRIAGNAFFVSMLLLTASAAFLTDDPTMAINSFYFAATAWVIILRPEKKTGIFEILAFLTAIILSVYFINFALSMTGFYRGAFLLFGSVMAIAAALDLNMIIRGGLSGKHRIARHLWRMCYALGGAVASFSANTSDKWPEFIDGNFPIYLVLGIMLVWLIIVLFTKWFDKARLHFSDKSAFSKALLNMK